MRTGLRVAALLLILGVSAFWFFSGANPGWTKTSVAIKRKDPVTELEVDDFVKRFVPGMDFLTGGLGIAAVIAGSSFFFRNRTDSPNKTNN